MTPCVFCQAKSSVDTWCTGQATQSNAWFGVPLQLRHIQCQKRLRKHSGSGRFLAEMWPSVPCSLPRSLRTVDVDCLRRQFVTLSGTGSDKSFRIVTAMLRRVFCGAQGATHAFVTTVTMLADALTKALVHCPSLLAAMIARRHVFVTSDSSTGVRTTFAASLRRCTNPQDGHWISADSISRSTTQE